MKKVVLAAALGGISTLAIASSAMAADLPSRKAPPVFAQPAPPPIFTWTGYYVGLTAGYAFNGHNDYTTFGNTAGTVTAIGTGARPGFIRNNSNGFTGGGEIGYNYQIPGTSYLGNGGIVVGLEADAAYVGPGSSAIYGSTAGSSIFHSRTEFLGTVRGRVGYAFDRVFVYGTGGFAYGGVDNRADFYDAAGINTFTGSRSTMKTGYAYGGGIAYAIPTTSFVNFMHSGAVTLKAEYLHYDLGSTNMLISSGTGASYTSRVKTQGDLVRAGIDYKIDFFPTPAAVVAKY